MAIQANQHELICIGAESEGPLPNFKILKARHVVTVY